MPADEHKYYGSENFRALSYNINGAIVESSLSTTFIQDQQKETPYGSPVVRLEPPPYVVSPRVAMIFSSSTNDQEKHDSRSLVGNKRDNVVFADEGVLFELDDVPPQNHQSVSSLSPSSREEKAYEKKNSEAAEIGALVRLLKDAPGLSLDDGECSSPKSFADAVLEMQILRERMEPSYYSK